MRVRFFLTVSVSELPLVS
uniref:Uncharacterized protein n=1 Tax=Anguilla anguilla TaxID=7936 RepID=A0A0E9U6G6_ANGAN